MIVAFFSIRLIQLWLTRGLVVLALAMIAVGVSLIEKLSPLDPTIFRLPASAREVVSKRTAFTATFNVGPNRFAAVSSGEEMFTTNIFGQRVLVELDGRLNYDHFVFNRLPQGVHVSFDLRHPGYTWQQGKRRFTLRFLVPATGVIEDGRTIAYKLSDQTTLRWVVDKTNISKEILVSGPGSLPDLSFQIVPDKNLTVDLVNNELQFRDLKTKEVVYTSSAPYLMDAHRNKLDRVVRLVADNDRYRYDYNAEGLAYPYILDPSVGPRGPGTIISDNTSAGCTNTIAWTNIGNVTGSDNVYASYMQGITRTSRCIDATNFGFVIPSGSMINGITVAVERKASLNTGVEYGRDLLVKLIKGGVLVGTNKADLATHYPTSDAVATYGGSADLWGTTWIAEDINSSNFGAAFAAYNYSAL